MKRHIIGLTVFVSVGCGGTVTFVEDGGGGGLGGGGGASTATATSTFTSTSTGTSSSTSTSTGTGTVTSTSTPTGTGTGTGVNCSNLPTEQCTDCCISSQPNAWSEYVQLVLEPCLCVPNTPCVNVCAMDPLCQGGGIDASPECLNCLDNQPQVQNCLQFGAEECLDSPSCAPLLECAFNC